MSRILILFASSHGQTRRVAEAVAERLYDRGHEVDVCDACSGRPPAPAAYDAVVMGSRVEFGFHHRRVTRYIRHYLTSLRTMPTAFFSVSMSASTGGPDPRQYMARLFRTCHFKPGHYQAFAGGLPYTRYGPLTRYVMKRISESEGHDTDTTRDHSYTDWTEVRAFADRFAGDLEMEEGESRTERPRPSARRMPLTSESLHHVRVTHERE